MYKVVIKDSNNVVTNGAIFQTEQEVNDWYDFNLECFPEGHTKIVTSVADIALDNLREKESTEAISLGENLIIQIRSLNRKKLKSEDWDQEKFNALLSNATAAQIERALWNGSLSTASYLMDGMTEFYSSSEISKITDQINAHETKWSTLT